MWNQCWQKYKFTTSAFHMHVNFLTCMWNFVIHVTNFCHMCELFFPCILLHVKSFHTHETILLCMWTSNFTCIIDTMHVKNFTRMWTLFYACQSEHVDFFQGLLNATTMNHMFMKMPWMSVEYPMKSISWPTKTAKLNFMPLFLAMNFLCKGNFLFNDSWIFFITKDSWALNFPRKLVKEYFMGRKTMEQDFQGIKFSMNSSQSISWAIERDFHGPLFSMNLSTVYFMNNGWLLMVLPFATNMIGGLPLKNKIW